MIIPGFEDENSLGLRDGTKLVRGDAAKGRQC